MKVALIDIGVSNSEIDKKIEVRHFSFKEGRLIEEYKEPTGKHGTDCYKEIVLNTKISDIQILDLNISDESGDLKVPPMISAIEKSIEERVDLINISLGLSNYSQELYDVCEKAVQNNILILAAASHSNTISFPADFNNVICVKVDQNQTEKIKKVDDTTISISMKDYIITEKNMKYDFSSSSMACARACGYFCDEFSEMPLNDKFKMLSKRYNINIHNKDVIHSSSILEKSEIQKLLSNNRVAVVFFPFSILENINKNMIHENIIAYYHYEKEGFYSFSDNKETNDFDIILLLNTLYHDLEIPAVIEKYRNYKMIYIGNFFKKDNNDYLRNYSGFVTSVMSVLEKPIIAIAGLCSGLNKLDVQISLLNYLKKDGLNIKAVSNNPLSIIYNTEVFNYPTELKFPDIVYSINKFMYLAEINENFDAWLINIGGAIGQVNNLNTYNFGKLADAYFSASDIDAAVMCVNTFVDVTNLKLQLANLYKHGIEKIFVVLSHYDIDASTMDYRDGLQTYYVNNEKYLEAFDYLKANINEKVYKLDDVKNGKLYEDVIEALS